MQRVLANILIAAGTVGAALGVARTDPSVPAFASTVQVHLPLTLLCLGLLIAGIASKRRCDRANRAAAAAEGGSLTALHQAGHSLLEQLSALEEVLDAVPVTALHERIDMLSSQPLARFHENRQALSDAFGAAAYAAVMAPFAVGERYVNRAWSASADGYVDEARASIRRAAPELRRAAELLGNQR